jgi:hypothetical protein
VCSWGIFCNVFATVILIGDVPMTPCWPRNSAVCSQGSRQRLGSACSTALTAQVAACRRVASKSCRQPGLAGVCAVRRLAGGQRGGVCAVQHAPGGGEGDPRRPHVSALHALRKWMCTVSTHAVLGRCIGMWTRSPGQLCTRTCRSPRLAGLVLCSCAITAGFDPVVCRCQACDGVLTVRTRDVCRLVARQPPPSAATHAELELMGRARGPGSNDAWQDESSDDDSDRVRPSHRCSDCFWLLRWLGICSCSHLFISSTMITGRGTWCQSGNCTIIVQFLLGAAFNDNWLARIAG